eukprot:GHVN01019448.1.p1 GENE.GHVN01019448.1~~GHVN01019448.1.p1  ORF type:complete len:777 (-),score=40.11 GHVN01019448.1:358-2688(-)
MGLNVPFFMCLWKVALVVVVCSKSAILVRAYLHEPTVLGAVSRKHASSPPTASLSGMVTSPLSWRVGPPPNTYLENMKERAFLFFNNFTTSQIEDRDLISEFDRSFSQPRLLERTIVTNATSLLNVLEEANKVGVELPALKSSLLNHLCDMLAKNMNASQLVRLGHALTDKGEAWHTRLRALQPLKFAIAFNQRRIARTLSLEFKAEEAEILRFFPFERWRVVELIEAFVDRITLRRATARDVASLCRTTSATARLVDHLKQNQKQLLEEASPIDKVQVCKAVRFAGESIHSIWMSEVHKDRKFFEEESSIKECLDYAYSLVTSSNITEVQEMVDTLNIRRHEILQLGFSKDREAVGCVNRLCPVFERIRADNLTSRGMENELIGCLNEEGVSIVFRVGILRSVSPVLPRRVALEQFENMAPNASVMTNSTVWPLQPYAEGLRVMKMESKNFTKFLIENAPAVVDRLDGYQLSRMVEYLKSWGRLKDFLSNVATHASITGGYLNSLDPKRIKVLVVAHDEAGVNADWLFGNILLRMAQFVPRRANDQFFIASVRKLGGYRGDLIISRAVEFAAREMHFKPGNIRARVSGLSASPELGFELLRKSATIMKAKYQTMSYKAFSNIVETAVAHREEFGSPIPKDLQFICPMDFGFQNWLFSVGVDKKRIILFINCARAGVRMPVFYEKFAEWIPKIPIRPNLMCYQLLEEILGNPKMCTEMEPYVMEIMKALRDRIMKWPPLMPGELELKSRRRGVPLDPFKVRPLKFVLGRRRIVGSG